VALSLIQAGCSRLVLADLSDEGLERLINISLKDPPADLQILNVVCDVRNPEDVDGMVEKAIKKFGAIHYCVNCAGVVAPAGSTAEISLQDFKLSPEVNQRGVGRLHAR
jgi:NAD(P)-dependent dehydrogenase (short-subunit alcohol dehydrogenase family)